MNIHSNTLEVHDDWDDLSSAMYNKKPPGIMENEPAIVSAQRKDDIQRYNSSLVFKSGERIVSGPLIMHY